MTQLLVLGIDALDPHLLTAFKNELPNFSRLMETSPQITLRSIFPPDTVPAWVSIYTGRNPAKHGVLYAADVFGSSWRNLKSIDSSIFKGTTFWDFASDAGKQVCVVSPQLTYPPWPVNGIFVGKSIDHRYATYPTSIYDGYEVDQLGHFTGEHPGPRHLDRFEAEARRVTEIEASLALRLSREHSWDLFFAYFGWLDLVKHWMWRYYDHTDPTYPGRTRHEDTICKFYKLCDEIVGEFLRQHPDATTIVLSDHGHGMRPPKTININEYLRRKGFLRTPASRYNPKPYVTENLKRIFFDLACRFELDYHVVRIATRAPLLSSRSKGMYTSKSNIGSNGTLASLSTFMGPKSYPHGGIEINKRAAEKSGRDYEQVRDSVINALLALELKTGERPVLWAKRREQIYDGQYISKYPDVLFELMPQYGVYWGVHCPLVGRAYEHNLASGGHKKDAVFLISNCDRQLARSTMSLMDVAPTILDLLGVSTEQRFDGSSIFQTANAL
jgi:predicted AlkP superfamily phosphohydrolase/phosphomutase